MRLKRLLPAIMGGGVALDSYIKSLAPIAYWPLNETSGTTAVNYGSLGTAANGTYSGATLAQVAAPGGGLAPYLDGADDFINVYSAALNGAFTGVLGSIAVWWKVYDAGVWTDGTRRDIGGFYIDAGNYWVFGRTTVNNTLTWLYMAGSTLETITTTAYNNTNWHLMALTFTDAGDEVKAYMDGVQVGSTATGIGTWNGALGSAVTLFGNNSTVGLNYDWYGYLAHAQIYTKVLTQPQLAKMYALGGV